MASVLHENPLGERFLEELVELLPGFLLKILPPTFNVRNDPAVFLDKFRSSDPQVADILLQLSDVAFGCLYFSKAGILFLQKLTQHAVFFFHSEQNGESDGGQN